MTLRRRIEILKKKAAEMERSPAYTFAGETAAHRAEMEDFFAGGEPFPPGKPCPPWLDPEEWAGRHRVDEGVCRILRGDFHLGERPPHLGLSESEWVSAEGYVRVLCEFANDLRIAELISPDADQATG